MPQLGSRLFLFSSVLSPGATNLLIPVQQTNAGTKFAVKLHPRAKRNAITGEVGDALKLALTAPPVDGKANAACIEFFAKLLKVSPSSVTIAAGQTSRNKSDPSVGPDSP